ncbi:DUF1203 domain-containing protein [Pseudoalteromonas sp. T1lg65]|uniref:DUF1203 domain-containing protein n=1 Tax=Pseudoalteromonas sp. T1lg65 TaxID=2077101 RepID=UPI003F7979DE
MSTNFIIKGLQKQSFLSLMSLTDTELLHHKAAWVIADVKPGYPCRVSLQEAEIGERVLLVHYRFHDVQSAYAASGPIFVRENAQNSELDINEIPEVLQHRLLSFRAYNQQNNMIAATTAQGTDVMHKIQSLFSNIEVAYIQIHNANPGCFSCSVLRV